MPQVHRKGCAIAQVPRKDLLETTNALITPHLFFGLETIAPAALVPASSALTEILQNSLLFSSEKPECHSREIAILVRRSQTNVSRTISRTTYKAQTEHFAHMAQTEQFFYVRTVFGGTRNTVRVRKQEYPFVENNLLVNPYTASLSSRFLLPFSCTQKGKT